MRMYEIIEKKRDCLELTAEEISFFIHGYCRGDIPDYQASALLMAIFLNGMTENEIVNITNSMAYSGDTYDLSLIPGKTADKHSTGGVGDKITLVVAPMVASCGVSVAKMCGKSLGHTGGTIDKLRSIPGFKTNLSKETFINNVKSIGLSISEQTSDLVPADKKLYELRDLTATVNSVPLIASSIMSKKIALGTDIIVLDVKTGSGALVNSLENSEKLAKTMIKIGKSLDKHVVAFITNMDSPLGNHIGNSLEIIEAIETLKGNGPEDVVELSVKIGAKMLELSGKGDYESCIVMAENSINDGSALKKFSEFVKQQGGNADIINDYSLLGSSEIKYNVLSEQDGYVYALKTDRIGNAEMLAAGKRMQKNDEIDYTSGIVLHKKVGSKVKKNDIIAIIHTNSNSALLEAKNALSEAIVYSENEPQQQPLVYGFFD